MPKQCLSETLTIINELPLLWSIVNRTLIEKSIICIVPYDLDKYESYCTTDPWCAI